MDIKKTITEFFSNQAAVIILAIRENKETAIVTVTENKHIFHILYEICQTNQEAYDKTIKTYLPDYILRVKSHGEYVFELFFAPVGSDRTNILNLDTFLDTKANYIYIQTMKLLGENKCTFTLDSNTKRINHPIILAKFGFCGIWGYEDQLHGKFHD